MTSSQESFDERIYEFITEDGEERVCEAIPDDACREAPRNFLLNALNGFCTKLAEQLASPGVVLPWILSTVGAPVAFSGFLVPVKNAGSLLPQLLVSAKIRAFAVRKYFWASAGAFQGLMLLLMALAIWRFEGNAAGYMVVSLLFLFSMGSGVGSIAFKDVMAKTIPKGKRGRLLATRATGGGILTLLAGLLFYFYIGEDENIIIYVLLICVAASLWLLAALLFAGIDELKGETEGGRSPVNELKDGWQILKTDANFRNFIFSRGLLMAIPLAQPFFVLFARSNLRMNLRDLGLFVIITGISNAVSSPFWGKFSDKSSRRLMIVSALFGIFICAYVLIFPYLPENFQTVNAFMPVFFLIVMAHGGARLGRKIYLVDYAPKKQRPLYISLANTIIGVFTILSGLVGIVAELFGLDVLILFLAALMLGSILLTLRLKEV